MCSDLRINKAQVKHSNMAANVGMLIMDPQMDFFPGGSCAIPAADNCALRIADVLSAHSSRVINVYVSLETHHRMHISNPHYWQSGETGEAPPSWLVINSADLENQIWRPRQTEGAALQKAITYTEQLELDGKPALMLWPEHCLLGTKGGAVVKVVNDAVQDWAGTHPDTPIEYIIKGNNSTTEMHSVFEAEVPDPEDPSTCFNLTLLERLSAHDFVLVCGYSLSHSIDRTLRHLLPKLPAEKRSRVVLLSDCCCSIPGHEAAGERLMQFAAENGATVTKASELPELLK